MDIQNIIKLLKSKNEDDILLGYTILIKDHTPDEINSFITPLKLWTLDGDKYIRVMDLSRNWMTNWIKI